MIQLIGVKSECDIEIRQKFSIVSSKLEDKLKNVYKITANVLILSTCNRTEIYVDSNIQGEELINAVFDALGWSRELITYTFYAKVKMLLSI
ncbi:hypothetical protein [Clostridium ljungdahlii]|uniref:hypothetical protein n=1 Tax=Clostridium ljungdahlii TaxID=1538 RepID=UPI003870D321